MYTTSLYASKGFCDFCRLISHECFTYFCILTVLLLFCYSKGGTRCPRCPPIDSKYASWLTMPSLEVGGTTSAAILLALLRLGSHFGILLVVSENYRRLSTCKLLYLFVGYCFLKILLVLWDWPTLFHHSDYTLWHASRSLRISQGWISLVQLDYIEDNIRYMDLLDGQVKASSSW